MGVLSVLCRTLLQQLQSLGTSRDIKELLDNRLRGILQFLGGPDRVVGLRDQPLVDTLDEIRVVHEPCRNLVLPLESLSDGPVLSETELLQGDTKGGGGAGTDSLGGLLSPGLVGGFGGEGEKDSLNGVCGEATVDRGTKGSTKGDAVGGKSGGVLVDGLVDDVLTVGEGEGVGEVEFCETSLEVGEGAGVEVVGCDTGVAVGLLGYYYACHYVGAYRALTPCKVWEVKAR